MHSGETDRLGWELATELIVVKIRWFGILMGVTLIESRSGLHNPSAVRVFLAMGAVYAALDTASYRRGAVFLRRWPLFVSLMESTFIALLCFNDAQLQSPFRWYYLLSIICCAIRYPPADRLDDLRPPLPQLRRPGLGRAGPRPARLASVARDGGDPRLRRLGKLGAGFGDQRHRSPARGRQRGAGVPPRPSSRRASPSGPRRSGPRRPGSSSRRRWPPSACSPPGSPTRSATPWPGSAR